MVVVSPAVGKAMVKQLKRNRRQSPSDVICDLNVALTKAERERDEARAQVEELRTENDILRQKTKWADAPKSAYLQVNGIDVVNQVEAAKILNEPQYQISRWLKAGKFEKVSVPGRKKPMIAVRSLKKPERGQPGRPKKIQ